MELKERLRRLLSSKRGAAVITALGAAGMLLIMVSELIPEGREEEREQPESTAAYADSYCAETEQRLEEFLGHIEGAGEVEVYLSVAGGEEYEYAAERRESRTDNRTEEEKKYVIVSGEGGKSALIERIEAPEITGAAVLCSGGDQPIVQERIYRAVSAALELPATKIYVTKIG